MHRPHQLGTLARHSPEEETARARLLRGSHVQHHVRRAAAAELVLQQDRSHVALRVPLGRSSALGPGLRAQQLAAHDACELRVVWALYRHHVGALACTWQGCHRMPLVVDVHTGVVVLNKQRVLDTIT